MPPRTLQGYEGSARGAGLGWDVVRGGRPTGTERALARAAVSISMIKPAPAGDYVL